METGVSSKIRSKWLKWLGRIVLGYALLLAIILAITIIVILITFTCIIIDGLSESSSLGFFAETYLVPVSEFMWRLFTWLIPGL